MWPRPPLPEVPTDAVALLTHAIACQVHWRLLREQEPASLQTAIELDDLQGIEGIDDNENFEAVLHWTTHARDMAMVAWQNWEAGTKPADDTPELARVRELLGAIRALMASEDDVSEDWYRRTEQLDLDLLAALDAAAPTEPAL